MMWKSFLPYVLFSGFVVVLTFASSQANDDARDALTSADKPLNDLFSKQWIQLGDDGGIEGQIVGLTENGKRPLSELPIALVQNGKIVAAVRANTEGNFSFPDVAPGLYSLVSRTNQSFSAFAVQVLDSDQGKHLPTSIEVRPVRPAGDKVKEIVRAQVVPSFFLSKADEAAAASVDPIASERRFAASHVVKLDSQGVLRGQLAKPGMTASLSNVQGMTVFVLKQDEVVAKVESDIDGRFAIEGLTSGVYGFIAAGLNGFAATSFQVVDPGIALVGADGSKLVSVNLNDCCPILNCEVVPTCEVTCCEPQVIETIIEQPIVAACEQPVEEVIVDEPCGMTPTCGGSCGSGWGGGCGSGGGGGAGGGFGPLLGLAGLAGIAAVIANDDDEGGTNLNQPPVQVSPIN